MRGSPVVVPFRARRTRRDEVIRRLASRPPAAADVDGWAPFARASLESLGPVFGAFAAYMGSRIDLLPASECRELARARRIARVRPPEAVRALLSAQASGAGLQVVDLDPVPIGVSTVTQTHRARLPDGAIVQLEVHAASFDDSNEDLDLLSLAEGVFAHRVTRAALASAMADFRLRFAQEGDLSNRLALLQEAAREMRRGAPVLVPRAYPELCSPRVIITDILFDEGWTILGHEHAPPDQRPDAGAVMAAWLRQALFGTVCPLFAPGEPVAVCGERLVAPALVRLRQTTQQHLLAYTFAVAGEMPDRAWSALQPELSAAAEAQPAEQVERAFRRLVPFRDDRRTESGSAVADHVFLQWRAASQHGWMPASHLVPFYQGLFAVVCAAGDAGGDGDRLADAIRALRVSADVRQVGAWAAEADPMIAMERQMALLMELPQKLDRLLTTAADGAVRVQLVTAEGAGASRRNRAAAVIAVLLLVASAVVLAGALPWVRHAWASEPGRSVALMAAGAVLVWAVGRVR